MRRRRISPIDRIESSDETARQAVEGMMRWVSRDRPRDSANGVLIGVLIAGGLGLLTPPLAIVLWPMVAIAASSLAMRLLLGPAASPEDVARQRLRTLWFERALAGRVRRPAPNLTRRFRLMRDQLEPGKVIVAPPNSAGSRGWWLLTVAVFAIGMSLHSGLGEAAEWRRRQVIREQDSADPRAWVGVQGLNDDVLRLREARDIAMWAAIGAAAAVGAVATWVTIAGPLRIRARILRGACPECGYDLAGVPDALSPTLGARGCGPARCPECGSRWPRVAMATDDEAVACARPPQ